MLTTYKFGLAFMLLAGCGLLTVNPILGIIVMLFAVALFSSQQRREQKRDEERRHREILEAMKDK